MYLMKAESREKVSHLLVRWRKAKKLLAHEKCPRRSALGTLVLQKVTQAVIALYLAPLQRHYTIRRKI